MKFLSTVMLGLALTGCGAEVATTAATGAAIKKQEAEAAQQTRDMVQKKLDQAAQVTQQRTEQQGNADK